MARQSPNRAVRAFLLLVTSAMAGVLVALVAFPLVGGLGVAARASAESFENLPSELQIDPLPQRSTILAADGSRIADIFLQNRETVPLRLVPDGLRKAVVAIEDSRFYEHNGLDYQGLSRAMVTNLQARTVVQGGSTLTQQYVKNVLLERAQTEQDRRAAIEQSAARKLREARYALALEEQLSKDEILERYLNIAYFGSGTYGVASAATYYFGKPINKISLAEAALLAGLVKNPRDYNPTVGRGEAAVARRNVVLARMADNGFITAEKAKSTMATPLKLKLTKVPNGCQDATIAPFFCDYVRRSLEETEDVGRARLLRGGLAVRTTLDPALQRAVQAEVDAKMNSADRFAAAVVVVEPGTGAVKAMAVSRKFGKVAKPGYTEVPLATKAAYQPGSTFKIFTMVAALEKGIPLSLQLDSPSTYTSAVYFKNGLNGEPYVVRNAEPAENGFYDMRRATELSVNTYYLQLEERVGVPAVKAVAQRMGVSSSDVANTGPGEGSLTLGTKLVSPLQMANAYATLAARGVYCTPRNLLEIRVPDGKLPVPPRACKRVLSPQVADTVNDVMRGVITDGTGRGADIGRPAAGKTGTTQEFRAAWFTGFTPQLSASVWVGDPGVVKGNTVEVLSLRDVTINGEYHRRVYGGDVPASIWGAVMAAAHRTLPVRDFPPPDSVLSRGATSGVPDVSGLDVEAAKQVLGAAGFGTRVMKRRVGAAPIDEGLVARTSPRAGSEATAGAVIRIYVSNGRVYVPPPDPVAPASPADPPAQSPAPPAAAAPSAKPAASVAPTTPATRPPRPTPSGPPPTTPSRGPSSPSSEAVQAAGTW